MYMSDKIRTDSRINNHVLRANQEEGLPESPDTPIFGPPPAVGEGENRPAEPTTPNLPTPSVPSRPNRPSTRPEPIIPPAGTNRPNGSRPPQTGGTWPNFPGIPGGGQIPPITVIPIPIVPGGGQGNRVGYCTIRFLNAAVGFDTVNVSVGNRPLSHNLGYGEVSSYFIEAAGFKNIRVTEGTAGRALITQERFLFQEGDVYTIALVNNMEGISMVLISDSPCQNQMQNFACVRAANLSYNAPAVDVVNKTERVVFDDLRFKSVAAYKQVMQGEQTFFVTETMNGVDVFDMTEWIEPGRMYTLYVIGDAYVFPGLTGIFTEDYSLLLE